jgi:hypothetical protein
MTDLKGKTDKSGIFNTPASIIDRTTRQKMRKDMFKLKTLSTNEF